MRSSLRPIRKLAPTAAAALLLSVLTHTSAQTGSSNLPPGAPLVLHVHGETIESGMLNGAAYRIDLPDHWNHALVVYFHGYSERTFNFHPPHRLTAQSQPMLDRGYAVIASGYSQTGWALETALADTERLRRYFLWHYGQPRETFVVGGSMGGLLTEITLEQNHRIYAGGLDLCGSVVPTYEAFNRRFAFRAAFDAYFPGLLPPLDPGPASGYPAPPPETTAGRRRIAEALREKPAAAQSMRSLMALHSDADLVYMISYITFVVADMQHKAHGNPFDNRNYLYAGTNPNSTAEDNRLNDVVRRYTASPAARRYLAAHYTPTGHLSRPMLALHTTYDPLIPGNMLALFDHIVDRAGFGHRFVQQYVHRDGHCTMTEPQVGAAFDELTAWVHTGRQPTPGLLPQ